MCGRYALFETDKLAERYGVKVDGPIKPNYDAKPSQMMPVVTDTGMQIMRWGLIPVWAKDEKIGYKLFNAKSETVLEKPMWKNAVRNRRCLVPINGFYEWQKSTDGKHRMYIQSKEQSLTSLAGIWETWKHDGEEVHSFSILTTAPNHDMTPIHDRQPLVLHKADEELWLGADSLEEIQALLLPYGDNLLKIQEVINDSVNKEELILPIRNS